MGCGGSVMKDVDLVCPSRDGSGCKVLADQMTEKTCRTYCSMNGLDCKGGWEEEEENCEPTHELGCDRAYGSTSDLICECAPASTTENRSAACGGVLMQDVEQVCPSRDDYGCKVLADHMRGKTCRDYCSKHGLDCKGGWEEEEDNCVPTYDVGCDRTFHATSDLICECAARQR